MISGVQAGGAWSGGCWGVRANTNFRHEQNQGNRPTQEGDATEAVAESGEASAVGIDASGQASGSNSDPPLNAPTGPSTVCSLSIMLHGRMLQ